MNNEDDKPNIVLEISSQAGIVTIIQIWTSSVNL